jgi:ribosomal protein S18 acetylase RimI-like enzyme
VRILEYEPGDQARVQWLLERTPPWGRTYPAPQPLPEELESPAVTFPNGCFVALEDDIGGEALVGFLAVARVGDGEARPSFLAPHSARGRVHWCSVAPERWRLGIGRRLMEAGISRLREWGCESVILETTSTQEGAIALYESIGFVERGRTQNRIWTQVWMEHLSGGAAPPGSTQSNP